MDGMEAGFLIARTRRDINAPVLVGLLNFETEKWNEAR
jgi:hypothetical protein